MKNIVLKSFCLLVSICFFSSLPAQYYHNKVFYIKAKHSGKYLDVYAWSKDNNGKIVQWDFHGGKNQQFRFIDAGSGYYYIQNVHSGKYLNVQNGDQKNEARVTQYSKGTGDHFKFYVGGFTNVTIRARHSNKYLSVDIASQQNGAHIEQFNWMNVNNQKFILEPVLTLTKKDISGKTFFIQAKHSKKYLDVYGWSKQNGSKIVQWDFHGGKNQQFRFKSAGYGYYYIQSIYSGLYLRLHSASKADNVRIDQWSFSKHSMSQFRVLEENHNIFMIQARYSGKYLSIDEASQQNGADLEQFRLMNVENQRFLLTGLKSANVDFSYRPEDRGKLLYQVVAGRAKGNSPGAQFSAIITVKNKEKHSLIWNKVTFSYKHGDGETRQKSFDIKQKINGGDTYIWHNGRDAYHIIGNVITFSHPFPEEIEIIYEFAGRQRIIKKKKFKYFYNQTDNGRLLFPFKRQDLHGGEVVSGHSLHGDGGGLQVFALDMGVKELRDGKMKSLRDGCSGDNNSDYLCYGKPVYAMAGGLVTHFFNNIPENVRPCKDEADCVIGKAQINFETHSIPCHWGGMGNGFVIASSGTRERILYGHMIPGSLNPDLLKNNATVKKGDFLGLVGNSGNSWSPHLHIHAFYEHGCDDYEPRPMMLEGASVVEESTFRVLRCDDKPIPWFLMIGHSLPPAKSIIIPTQ